MNKYRFTLFTIFTLCNSSDYDSDGSGSCISVVKKRTSRKASEGSIEMPVTPLNQGGTKLSSVLNIKDTPEITAKIDSPTFSTSAKLPQPLQEQPQLQSILRGSQSVPRRRLQLPGVEATPKDDIKVHYSSDKEVARPQRIHFISQPVSVAADSPVDAVRIDYLPPISISPDPTSPCSVSSGATVRQSQIEERLGIPAGGTTTPTFPIGTPEPSSNDDDTPSRCMRCKKNSTS